MLDYIDRNGLTLEQFEQVYRRDHGVGLSEKQRRVIEQHLGRAVKKRPTRFRVHNQRRAFRIFRRRPDAKEVQVVRGKSNKLIVRYFKDRRGQMHKTGKDHRFQHLTKKERKGLGLSTKRSTKVK
jgi:hypothetical protein